MAKKEGAPRPPRKSTSRTTKPTGSKTAAAKSAGSKPPGGRPSGSEPGTRYGTATTGKSPFGESRKNQKSAAKPDHTGGWRAEKTPGEKPQRSNRTQYRKLQDKTWKGRPVVEVRHTMRLNKYIANAGICSRREADNLISQGLIEVNGKQITEMGYQVQPADKVTYAGERINPEKPVYVLLNKPKDYITVSKDPSELKTVMTLLRRVGDVRLVSVGRLDRNTSGLLLFTNDGHMAKKLAHSSHGVKNLYHVHTDKAVKPIHLKSLLEGVPLEHGLTKASEVAYVDEGKDKKQVGIELLSGRSQTVRKLFEHLGYKVLKLDRVTFAGLTKKDLPRGKWRNLTEQEISRLKML